LYTKEWYIDKEGQTVAQPLRRTEKNGRKAVKKQGGRE
jgi:hypothetical protein